jgi:hypothetical protein
VPDAAWDAAFDRLMADVRSGQDSLRVELRSGAEMQGAFGAFSPLGTTGQPTIYLNADRIAAGVDAQTLAQVIVEEMGHHLDHRLNAVADTAGDEGEAFSRHVVHGTPPAALPWLAQQEDHATYVIDGAQVAVEQASFFFGNAYEMVYDQDGGNDIDTTERWADKEQNLHYFNASNSLGQVLISDGTGGTNFSGNDISVIANIGGTDHFGWVSRPIKSGGVVRGFYFWRDDSFTTLALAQADGNQDGDRNVTNNRGFVMVVDQTWFTNQIATTGTTVTVNSTKDGTLGTITRAEVGSSSDRVDSALNALLNSNTAPVPADDVAAGTPSSTLSTSVGNAALEQGDNTNTSTV